MCDTTRIDDIFRRLMDAAPDWEPTSLEAFAGQPFQVMITAMLSTQTREERTTDAARRLFALADNPRDMLALDDDTIREAIRSVSFYNNKVINIHRICERLVANGGDVPRDIHRLLEYEGIGWKVGALVLDVGHNIHDFIAVDTHVDRISKRLGLVPPSTKGPQQIEAALKKALPRRYWHDWNGVMVQFGRAVCRARGPLCDTCLIHDLCPRIGVD
jgi:endonuclease-3